LPLFLAILHGHGPFPIGPVAIFDAQSDRRTDGLSVADAGKGLGAVFLDFLSPAASITQLAPVQFAVDEFEIHAQPGRQA